MSSAWLLLLDACATLNSIFLLLCSHLQVKLGDASHQYSDILVGLSHFGLVLSVFGLEVVDVASRLEFNSLDGLFVFAVSLMMLSFGVLSLLKLFFVVIAHLQYFLLSCLLDLSLIVQGCLAATSVVL